jgi:hypothetical protein
VSFLCCEPTKGIPERDEIKEAIRKKTRKPKSNKRPIAKAQYPITTRTFTLL